MPQGLTAVQSSVRRSASLMQRQRQLAGVEELEHDAARPAGIDTVSGDVHHQSQTRQERSVRPASRPDRPVASPTHRSPPAPALLDADRRLLPSGSTISSLITSIQRRGHFCFGPLRSIKGAVWPRNVRNLFPQPNVDGRAVNTFNGRARADR